MECLNQHWRMSVMYHLTVSMRSWKGIVIGQQPNKLQNPTGHRGVGSFTDSHILKVGTERETMHVAAPQGPAIVSLSHRKLSFTWGSENYPCCRLPNDLLYIRVKDTGSSEDDAKSRQTDRERRALLNRLLAEQCKLYSKCNEKRAETNAANISI
ncbi:unnamed protein product [Leuciscus chuanchicus]